jgi:hypothetical protein
MIQQRSHVKHTETLKNRLSKAAVQFEEVAAVCETSWPGAATAPMIPFGKARTLPGLKSSSQTKPQLRQRCCLCCQPALSKWRKSDTPWRGAIIKCFRLASKLMSCWRE